MLDVQIELSYATTAPAMSSAIFMHCDVGHVHTVLWRKIGSDQTGKKEDFKQSLLNIYTHHIYLPLQFSIYSQTRPYVKNSLRKNQLKEKETESNSVNMATASSSVRLSHSLTEPLLSALWMDPEMKSKDSCVRPLDRNNWTTGENIEAWPRVCQATSHHKQSLL